MRFFRELLRPTNPTQSWARDPSRPLELDLDSHSLSGVPLGSVFDRLEFLGPAKRSRPDAELWEFSSLGVAVEVSSAGIVGYFVVPIPDEHFDVAPYKGAVVIGGQCIPIARILRERDLPRALGEPTRRDEDDEETVLFYEVGRVERQIELTPDGRIKTIAVFSQVEAP